MWHRQLVQLSAIVAMHSDRWGEWGNSAAMSCSDPAWVAAETNALTVATITDIITNFGTITEILDRARAAVAEARGETFLESDMPIGLLPTDTFAVNTSLDEHLPDEQRVKLKVRAVSVGEARRVGQLWRQALTEKTLEAENDCLNEALLIGVVGWSLPDPITAEALDKALSMHGKYHLCQEYPSLCMLGESEKKRLLSSRTSGAALSAGPAAVEGATIPQPSKAP